MEFAELFLQSLSALVPVLYGKSQRSEQSTAAARTENAAKSEQKGARGGFPPLPTEASFLQILAVSVLGLSAWLGPVAWDAAAASLALSSTHSPSEHSTSSKMPVGMWGC